MRAHYLKLFAYDLWANGRIIETLLTHEVSDEKSLYWMSHVLNAEQAWFERIISGKNDPAIIHQVYPAAELPDRLKSVNGKYKDWLTSLPEDEFDRNVQYKTSLGESFTTQVADILTHVVNHATHHRAQTVARLRGLDIAPPSTDFSVFVR